MTTPHFLCGHGEVLVALTMEIATLRERCTTLEGLAQSCGDEASSYRLLAYTAIYVLHQEQVDHGRLRAQHRRVVDEYREHRERTLRGLDERDLWAEDRRHEAHAVPVLVGGSR